MTTNFPFLTKSQKNKRTDTYRCFSPQQIPCQTGKMIKHDKGLPADSDPRCSAIFSYLLK